MARNNKILVKKMKICQYCGEGIKENEPSVQDEWGEKGGRMHIGCAAEDQDGRDLDMEFGDN